MKSASLLVAALLLSQSAQAFDPEQIARDALEARAQEFGLRSGDLGEMRLSDRYQSRHNGVWHVWLQQQVDGLPVALALANANISRNGEVLSLHSRMSTDAATRTASRTPTLSAIEAIDVYARIRQLDRSVMPVPVARTSDEDLRFSPGSLAQDEIPTRLAWLEHEGRLHLVWDIVVQEQPGPDWFNAFIDAHSGEVLRAVNWTQHASYRVFPDPLESPAQGPEALIVDPEDAQASPLGWHDDGTNQFTDTRGNNVLAQEDTDANNSGGRRPNGGAGLVFDFPIDLSTQQPNEYEDFAITNLFFWNNRIHDILWHHGFDEPSGNFQTNNFGRGGLGNDAVRADAQDGSGTNNANFGTPPDGSPPRMQMFVWTGSSPGTLTVDAPAPSAGNYPVAPAGFGPDLGDPGTAGNFELVDDGSANPEQGCGTLTGFTAGNIALVRRGSCEFGVKALNAQNAGATAVVVINNVGGNGTLSMGPGAVGNQVSIPTAMIGNDNGNLIVADLGGTVSGRLFQVGGPGLNRDSDLDAGVIAHEYGHGLSNRLTGGPSQASCLFGNQQAGEGWSDFLGLWVSAKADDVLDAPRGVGSYLIFQENTPGAGIRPWPYTRDMSINPATYESIRSVSIPHGVGTVFNTALWDMYLNLVEKHGFDPDFINGTGGNNLALRLVIDGMKMHPCGPTFLDTRDAMLMADQVNNNGENQCEIWDAFARRGMGVDAFDGGSSDSLNVTNGFELPVQCQVLEVFFEDGFES